MKFYSVLLVVFLLSVSFVYSFDASIDVKKKFSLGEQVFFTLNFPDSEEVSFFSMVSCPKLPSALSSLNTVSGAGSFVHYDFVVADTIETQVCEAVAYFESPVELVVKKPFKVKNLRSVNSDFFVCKSKKCDSSERLFVLGDKLRFVSGAKFSGTIVSPSGNEVAISKQFVPSELGTYSVFYTLTKKNRIPVSSRTQFVVIDAPVLVEEEVFCNLDSVCDLFEDGSSCSDCAMEALVSQPVVSRSPPNLVSGNVVSSLSGTESVFTSLFVLVAFVGLLVNFRGRKLF